MIKNIPCNKYHYFVFALTVCFLIPSSSFAGPPFRTDDPEPVEYGHWEFYVASQIAWDNIGTSGMAPYGEVNYGIAKWMHIHLNVPLCFNQPHAGNAVYGLGDIEFGFKCRLVNETTVIPQIGTYPVIEIPTGNAEKDLGVGNVQFFIPVWLQKSWGPWTTNCGGGYLVNTTSNPVNSLFIGWEGQRDVSELITVGAEIFSTIIPSERSENELAFNIGTIVSFNDNHHFLFSAGRDIIGNNYFFLFAAYQLIIGSGPK
jgi:hypothetical protein